VRAQQLQGVQQAFDVEVERMVVGQADHVDAGPDQRLHRFRRRAEIEGFRFTRPSRARGGQRTFEVDDSKVSAAQHAGDRRQRVVGPETPDRLFDQAAKHKVATEHQAQGWGDVGGWLHGRIPVSIAFARLTRCSRAIGQR
jgi:hypothetical protein